MKKTTTTTTIPHWILMRIAKFFACLILVVHYFYHIFNDFLVCGLLFSLSFFLFLSISLFLSHTFLSPFFREQNGFFVCKIFIWHGVLYDFLLIFRISRTSDVLTHGSSKQRPQATLKKHRLWAEKRTMLIHAAKAHVRLLAAFLFHRLTFSQLYL